MNSPCPKLREDLTIRPQDTNSGRFFIVKDGVSGQFFRLREVEGFITRQFDGETPANVIRARVQERFGAALDPETLKAFTEQLRASGLFEGDRGSSVPSDHQGRFRGSLLYLRFKVLDPTWIFDRIGPWIPFLFTPYFLVFSYVSILFAAMCAAVNWGDLVLSFRSLMEPSSIPLYVTFAFLTVGLHEFAHGLTCRHFGGAVHEMGFLLVYFQPAFYCNVSDAWLFSEKSKRLWVAFAGPYFELFLWSLAVQVWRATEPGYLINKCALAVVAISGAKTLFNFNPLIKLDGYYLLSDFLEIPNLREKSFRGLGDAMRRLVGRKVAPRDDETKREQRLCLVYGIIAASGSFALMGGLFLSVLSYFGEGSRPALLMIPLVAALVLRSRQWSDRLFTKTAKPAKSPAKFLDDDHPNFESTSASTASTSAIHEVRRKTTPGSRGRARSLRWVLRALCLGVVAWGVATLAKRPVQLRVSGPFNVLPGESTDVRVTVDGLIDKLYVHEGDRVTAGSLIAMLSDRDLRANLEKTGAQIREARAKLRMLEAGATQHDIAVAEAAVNKVAEHIPYAQKKVERAKALFDAGLIPRTAYEDAEEQAWATEGDLGEAKARLTALMNNVRPEQLEEIAAQIDRLDTDRRLTLQQLGSLRVLSPVAGIVGTPERQLLQMAHQFAGKGAPIAKIYKSTTVKAQIAVSEKEIAEVQMGQVVQLRARAYPQQTFQSKVTFIATSAGGTATGVDSAASAVSAAMTGKTLNIVFVNTEIDNPSSLLKPEMTGEAMIDCGQKRLADLVLWRINRYLRVDSFWW